MWCTEFRKVQTTIDMRNKDLKTLKHYEDKIKKLKDGVKEGKSMDKNSND